MTMEQKRSRDHAVAWLRQLEFGSDDNGAMTTRVIARRSTDTLLE